MVGDELDGDAGEGGETEAREDLEMKGISMDHPLHKINLRTHSSNITRQYNRLVAMQEELCAETFSGEVTSTIISDRYSGA